MIVVYTNTNLKSNPTCSVTSFKTDSISNYDCVLKQPTRTFTCMENPSKIKSNNWVLVTIDMRMRSSGYFLKQYIVKQLNTNLLLNKLPSKYSNILIT